MPAEEAYAKARAAAEKALKLDNTLAEAHSALGSVMVRADWDWSGPSGNSRRRSHSIPVTRWPTPSMATSSYRQSGDGTTTRSLSWSGRRARSTLGVDLHGDRLGLLSCTAMGSVSRAVPEGARVGLEVVPATHRLRAKLCAVRTVRRGDCSVQRGRSRGWGLRLAERCSRLGLRPGGSE